MFEYRYVTINTGGGFLFSNRGAVHRPIIEEQAREGWRFVTSVPTEFTTQGGIAALDLVFEREKKEDEDL